MVLVAALSEKIVYLAKHFASHRKDAAGMRGFRVSIPSSHLFHCLIAYYLFPSPS